MVQKYKSSCTSMLQFLLQKMECSCWNVGIPRKKKKEIKRKKKRKRKSEVIWQFYWKSYSSFYTIQVFLITSVFFWSFRLEATLLDKVILFKPKWTSPLPIQWRERDAFEVLRGAFRSFRLVSGFLCSMQSVYLTVNKVPFADWS